MQSEIIQRAEITCFKTKPKNFFPLSWYKKMLEEEPILYHAGTDTWNVFRYNDVKRVLSDYELSSSKRTRTITNVGFSDLIQAVFEGEKFTDEEIVRMTMFLLGAGIETTSHLLASSFYSLLYDDPELYQELRSNINLVPLFVEEMLRYRFHISKMDRTVKEDNHVLGVHMKKGDVVIAWMSASNMDKNVFEDPFTLNIHRENNNRHQTFAMGRISASGHL
ncbi:hypothetical protein BRE01_42060 [Brevibacillus reuszeri]|uniref:Cytochrome P450 n=1 Tax=Brevibacillus reuszeri TaxID=54915 RepID=A0ABQ0TRQ2_9BACL|nr:hypothetical protein BRE01_42060 [Brevibacillus reuszeri]